MPTQTPRWFRPSWYVQRTLWPHALRVTFANCERQTQNLAIIPALLHAAILGLLTAAIPLKTIATAVTLAIPAADSGSSGIVVDPSTREADTAKSLHVLGYTSGEDELLLAESQGAFTVDEWETVLRTGQDVCCRAAQRGLEEEDTAMTGSGLESASIRAFIRSVIETKTAADNSWK